MEHGRFVVPRGGAGTCRAVRTTVRRRRTRTTASLGRLTATGGSLRLGRWAQGQTAAKDEEAVIDKIRSVRDLEVYRVAFDAAMKIYELSKSFPKEETYS